ncbi:choloylglycine hydrolase family protein [Kiritimatiellota bacterium B12222]|nr:choloylglycine hydrolase family protein [Kiritimatiellota bacterium B12222]
MKMKRLAICATSFGLLFSPINSQACTGLHLIAADGGVVAGRTMEFGFDIQSDAIVVPAGTPISNSLSDPSKGMHYTSKWGMVGANALGKKIIVDGVNEKGLYVGTFYFAGEAGYADPASADPSRSLAPEDYGAWLLANFENITQVKAHFQDVTLLPHPIEEIGGISFPGHFIVRDSSGASVVIEPINGQLKIYDNPLGVMTNTPSFDWHLTNLRNYINLSATNVPAVKAADIILNPTGQGSGMLGLPGDFTPPSRFIRAVFFSQNAEQNKTVEETVPQVFHIMNAFDIPRGAVREDQNGEVHADYTVWTSVSDLKNIRWAFRTYKNQSIRTIDVQKALAAAQDKIKTISMDSEQDILDVSTSFK